MQTSNNTNENKMGYAPMVPLIFSMSLPAVISMFIQGLYNIVDSIFVAQIGEEALTAVSLAFPVQLIMIGIAVGTGIGINSKISRSLGSKNKKDADKVASYSIPLALFCSIFFIVFGLFFSRNFIGLFTDNKEVMDMSVYYLSVVCTFSFGVFVQINIEKTLQSTGNMIYPMMTQLLGAVVNIIFDPIFIFGLYGFPKMGVSGAAFATVLGQICAMIMALYILLAKSHVVNPSIKNFKFEFSVIKEIYKVGLPTAIMQTISSFVIIAINNVLIAFSTTAVAVYGIYFKLQSFIFMPAFGISQGTMPIYGYNFGAKNKNRIKSCLKISIVLVFVIMALGTALVLLAPDLLLKMFNAGDDMMAIGTKALTIMCSTFVLGGFAMVTITLLQAMGYGFKSLLITLMRQVVVIIPFAMIMSPYMGVDAVWWSYPIAETTSFIMCIILLFNLFKKLNLKFPDNVQDNKLIQDEVLEIDDYEGKDLVSDDFDKENFEEGIDEKDDEENINDFINENVK